nr:MAG TPA: hypothetical protein [Caudoviricetes sp.]
MCNLPIDNGRVKMYTIDIKKNNTRSCLWR